MAPGSTLLLEEFFEAGDDRFLTELLGVSAAGKLKVLATKWVADRRPFAHDMMLRYVDDGCDRPGHRPLVKALFKNSEARGDDEAMGHFLVAFDGLTRRQLKKKRSWNSDTRQVLEVQELVHDKSVEAKDWEAELFDPGRKGGPASEHGGKQGPVRTGINPFTKERVVFQGRPGRPALTRFARRTRLYLERRAWRYFRHLGRKDPARYATAIRSALALYPDARLDTPVRLLDSWALMHALYWASPVLNRKPLGIRLAEGQALSGLKPAPTYPAVWRGCRDELIALLEKAGSRTVRTWLVDWMRAEYSASELSGIPVGHVRRLLGSPHEEVQAFAAELLKSAEGLGALPISDWMELLKVENPIALPLICDLVAKHVSPSRLTLAQCVELAGARVAPVAELGLTWAKQKPIRVESDLRTVLPLANAATHVVREQATPWLCELMGTLPYARAEHLRQVVDARFEEPRAGALALMAKETRYGDNILMWTALAESPYNDVRTFLVKHLGAREGQLEPESLRHVWATTLLAVHRGGRAKQAVLRRAAKRVIDHPGEAESLIPLLAIALRSVRAPERRGALAALVRAASESASLRHVIARKFPELTIHDGVPA